ncbi:LacI family DNA-binding transcriptional regulator [Paeniglutamicibacter gangotriensis]|uniref:LacI family DNA-binding transcriptional regulator n=1 Tax=Paeniglutamicibacter gangotriensis TaxID=254787 RepID=UPI0021D3276A|nr:LacI family DNA-binding transcriptional regulator [Paeniglutamicibacter gangotriensis]
MVAKEVGVDLSTVSRVVNSVDKDARRWVSDAAIKRIREAAASSGYRRNPQAASLPTRRSGLVGVLVPRLQDYVLQLCTKGSKKLPSKTSYPLSSPTP